MAKKADTQNQGFGVLFTHVLIAKEYLKQNGMKETDASLKTTIQKLADEKAESYTPNPMLGRNPESRVAPNIRKITAAPIYGYNGLLAKLIPNKIDKQSAQVEIGGSVNQLTQFLLKHVYKLQTTRRPNADVSNPDKITDFEYLASGPGNDFSVEQRKIYNKHVDANRYVRIMIEAYLFSSLSPLLKMSVKDYQDILLGLKYDKTKRKTSSREFALLNTKLFGSAFERFKLSDFFKKHRWNKEGKLVKGKSSSL